MRLKRANRMIRGRHGYAMKLHQGPRGVHADHIVETLGWMEYRYMFESVEIGQVIAIRTYDFPYVGRVEAIDDTRITLADAVMVLWDGRHGEFFGKGKVPQNAEVEKTLPILHVSLDDVRMWGPFPGGKIPNPQ